MAADNVLLNAGSGGSTVRTFSDGTLEHPAGVLEYVTGGSAGAWTFQVVDSTHGLPVAVIGTVTVTGTVTANAGSGTFTIQQSNVTTDYDTGAGTQTMTMFGLALPANGGAVAGGTSANPLRTDPTGTTTQPVSGTVAATQSGGWSVSISGTPSVNAQYTGLTTDYDTGAGTTNVTAFGIALPANGGPVAGGTSTNPLRTDPTGTTTQPVSGTVTANQGGSWSMTVSGTPAMNITQVAGAAIAQGHGTAATAIRVELPTDGTGLVNAAQSGTWTVQPGNTANTTAWLVSARPATSGGLSTYSFLSTAAVQAAAIKASAGQVYAIEFFNNTATPVYVRLYNQTTTPGTGDGANILWRGMVPGSTAGAGFVKSWDQGLAFGTGIGIRVTAAIADNDNTALSANTVIGNVEYA